MSVDRQYEANRGKSLFAKRCILQRGGYLTRLLFGLILAETLLVIFWSLTGDVLEDRTALFDKDIRAFVQQIATPVITTFLWTISRLGSTVYLTALGIAACIFFILLGWWRELTLFLIAMTGQIILHHVSKAIFERPRPEPFFDYPVAASYSFPSGHALASFCFYLVLAWLCARHVKSLIGKAAIWLPAAVLVLLIGFSRIYLGLHYPTDVIAGYLAALVWMLFVMSDNFVSERPACNE